MMRLALLAIATLALFSACAGIPHRTELDTLMLGADKPIAVTLNVPFVPQGKNLCGPTALLMVLRYQGASPEDSEMNGMLMSPGANGTYKQDFLAGSRRLGFAPYPVKTFREMLEQIAEGNPVVIFHSTAFLGKEYWHYSVLTGYDLREQKAILHIGEKNFYEMDMSRLIFNWELGGSWSYVVAKPEKLPSGATLEDSIANGLAFLRLGLLEQARKAGEAAIVRWPLSFEAEVVLADALFRLDQRKNGLAHLKRAVSKNPDNLPLRKKLMEFERYALAQMKMAK